MDIREVLRQRIASSFVNDEDPSPVTHPEAVRDARTVLAEAFRIDADGDAVVNGDDLALGALLFLCRWQLAPTGFEDPDAQTAYRLFAVQHTADPDVPIPSRHRRSHGRPPAHRRALRALPNEPTTGKLTG
jgi:hypothetical protein